MPYLFALLHLGAACSSTEAADSAATDAEAPAHGGCTQGDTRTCVGPGACEGGQACGDDGRWGDCSCGPAANEDDGPTEDGSGADDDAKTRDDTASPDDDAVSNADDVTESGADLDGGDFQTAGAAGEGGADDDASSGAAGASGDAQGDAGDAANAGAGMTGSAGGGAAGATDDVAGAAGGGDEATAGATAGGAADAGAGGRGGAPTGNTGGAPPSALPTGASLGEPFNADLEADFPTEYLLSDPRAVGDFNLVTSSDVEPADPIELDGPTRWCTAGTAGPFDPGDQGTARGFRLMLREEDSDYSWNATSRGVIGFAFEVNGAPPEGVVVMFVTFMGDPPVPAVSSYLQQWSVEGWTDGTQVLLFDTLPPESFSATGIGGMLFTVHGSQTTATDEPFDFCVSNLQPIFGEGI